MMDFPGYRAAVEQWIVDISGRYLSQGLRASDIFWESRPRRFLGKLWVKAVFDRPIGVGQDSEHYLEHPSPTPGAEIVPVMDSSGKVELQLSAYTFRAEDDYDAIALIDLLDRSLKFPSVNNQLQQAGLGFETTLASPGLTMMVLGQDRQLSAHQLRVRFHTKTIIADIPTTYVGSTTIASDLVTATGEPASTQIDGEFS